MSPDVAKTDLTFVTLIHQALRHDAARLQTTIAALDAGHGGQRLPAIRAYFDRYRAQLLLHHAHEDTLFFPTLEARIGAERIPKTDLAGQHQELDSTLEALHDQLTALSDPRRDFQAGQQAASHTASTMIERLQAHLGLEEHTVTPLLASELSPAQYRRLESHARRSTPRADAHFLIPWLVEHASPADQKALFHRAPPLRLIYLLNRRRYRRLDRALTLTQSTGRGRQPPTNIRPTSHQTDAPSR